MKKGSDGKGTKTKALEAKIKPAGTGGNAAFRKELKSAKGGSTGGNAAKKGGCK